jgi:hypothetical protein
LSHTMSYETLRLRMRGNRLGYVKMRPRTDVCVICKAWDDHAFDAILRALHASLAVLVGIIATYFDPWNTTHPLATLIALVDSPEMLASWLEFIRQHSVLHPLQRAGLADEAREVLALEEKKVLDEFKAPDHIVDMQKDFCWHFKIKEELKVQLDQDLASPEPGILYILCDFKVACTCHTIRCKHRWVHRFVCLPSTGGYTHAVASQAPVGTHIRLPTKHRWVHTFVLCCS